jgi:hypothetical protein
MHQVDLLFLPHDGKYKYVLTLIDGASRYKEAVPLKTKKAMGVADALQRMYDRSPLNFPQLIMCDYGHEFMGKFIELMKQHGVKIQRSLNKKKVALVERFNKTLSERLFAHQYSREMATHETNREWVDRLPAVVEALNNEETRMIGMKPVDAIKLETVKQPDYEEEIDEDLPLDSLVRYLYKPGEEHGDTRYRATDAIWSVKVYHLDEIRSAENQPSVYTLQDMPPERTFIREELQVIPTDTEHLE